MEAAISQTFTPFGLFNSALLKSFEDQDSLMSIVSSGVPIVPREGRGHGTPLVELAPLPTCAQFLNGIESVFSGMARAIIHNSDYADAATAKHAITRYFFERNERFKKDPHRAGKKIWGKERVEPAFNEANNCKDPRW